MKYDVSDVEGYLDAIPEERQLSFNTLRNVILKNLPKGFEEVYMYGMIGYVVPLSTYPSGYHCTPNTPLPFTSIASQKNFIALYHSGIYAISDLYNWFVEEYPKHSKHKLDMGKSCIRFKKMDEIPYTLISELMQKLSVEDWVKTYERHLKI